MLRNLVLAAALLATVAGLAVTITAGPAGFGLLLVGGLALVGSVFERVRYKRVASSPPGAPFQRTAERFRDPASGETITVYADPGTGKRVYVRE